MSLTAPELNGHHHDDRRDAGRSAGTRIRTAHDDVLVVTCAACDTPQEASGRALGYTCHTCGSSWRVLRCGSCRKASVVLDGTTVCPRCGHEHGARGAVAAPTPSWLNDPNPLSVWIGGVKYLGGHRERDQPVGSAGLLLDRRGIHLRAFAELFTIRWDAVRSMDIEGPLDISERMTMTRLLALGATTWAMQVAYLTISTEEGDAIFEVDGLGPPELHARLSRVLQGLQRSERPPAPIPLERGASMSAEPIARTRVAQSPAPAPTAPLPPTPVPTGAAEPRPLTVDPEQRETPVEVLVVDALWKLAHLRELGLLDPTEVAALRTRLLARIGDGPTPAGIGDGVDQGPLLKI